MSCNQRNMLSARELSSYRAKLDRTLPRKGNKEYAATNSWLEQKQVQSALDERKSLLEEERVEKAGSLSVAHWKPHLNLAYVTFRVGKYWEYFGHEMRGSLYLYPEEALYLIEINCLLLMHGGVALSLQQGYFTLLGEHTGLSLEKYRVYSHLLRQGYKVRRHIASLTVSKYVKQIRLDQHVKCSKTKIVPEEANNLFENEPEVSSSETSNSQFERNHETISRANSRVPNDNTLSDKIGTCRRESSYVNEGSNFNLDLKRKVENLGPETEKISISSISESLVQPLKKLKTRKQLPDKQVEIVTISDEDDDCVSKSLPCEGERVKDRKSVPDVVDVSDDENVVETKPGISFDRKFIESKSAIKQEIQNLSEPTLDEITLTPTRERLKEFRNQKTIKPEVICLDEQSSSDLYITDDECEVVIEKQTTKFPEIINIDDSDHECSNENQTKDSSSPKITKVQEHDLPVRDNMWFRIMDTFPTAIGLSFITMRTPSPEYLPPNVNPQKSAYNINLSNNNNNNFGGNREFQEERQRPLSRPVRPKRSYYPSRHLYDNHYSFDRQNYQEDNFNPGSSFVSTQSFHSFPVVQQNSLTPVLYRNEHLSNSVLNHSQNFQFECSQQRFWGPHVQYPSPLMLNSNIHPSPVSPSFSYYESRDWEVRPSLETYGQFENTVSTYVQSQNYQFIKRYGVKRPSRSSRNNSYSYYKKRYPRRSNANKPFNSTKKFPNYLQQQAESRLLDTPQRPDNHSVNAAKPLDPSETKDNIESEHKFNVSKSGPSNSEHIKTTSAGIKVSGSNTEFESKQCNSGNDSLDESDTTEESEEDSSNDENASEVESTSGCTPLLDPSDCTSAGKIILKLSQFIKPAKINISNAQTADSLMIDYDLYLPNTVFRKSSPSLPDYRISVVGCNDQVPEPRQMAELQKNFDDDIPLLFAVVSPESVAFFYLGSVELPLDPDS